MGHIFTARHDDPFDRHVIRDIKQHARLSFPFECCGVVINDTYVPLENTHDKPWQEFKIEPGFTAKYWDDIQAVLHSHPNKPAYPSRADKASSIPSGKIWGLTPVQDGQVMPIMWWGDPLPIPPLLRRSFIWNIFHCYQLYRDWWRLEDGTHIPDFPCDRNDFWRKKGENNHFIDHAIEAQHIDIGKPTSITDLKRGDLLLSRDACPNINHCGIYEGDDRYIHHPAGQLSQSGSIHRDWGHIEKVLRYEPSSF